jgi:hypothetical protein
VRASKELGAFADISAITDPYADALRQQHVVNIGSPYPSREWFETRRPYSWSLFPDGTNVVESSSVSFQARFPPGSNADFAGPSIKGRSGVRVVALPRTRSTRSRSRVHRKAKAAGLPIAVT